MTRSTRRQRKGTGSNRPCSTRQRKGTGSNRPCSTRQRKGTGSNRPCSPRLHEMTRWRWGITLDIEHTRYSVCCWRSYTIVTSSIVPVSSIIQYYPELFYSPLLWLRVSSALSFDRTCLNCDITAIFFWWVVSYMLGVPTVLRSLTPKCIL